MKICYVNPTFLVRRPIAELVSQLGNNNKVGIFVPKRPFKRVDKSWHSSAYLRKAHIYSYSAINLPFSKSEWPIPITLAFFTNLFKIFKNYDVVHMWTFFYINSIAVLLFKLFSRKTKLIMACDTFPGYSFKSGPLTDLLFKAYVIALGWLLFSIPNKIQVYSKSMLPFAKKAGIKREKMAIASTGINIEKFSKTKKGRIRKELGIKEKDILVVYAGLIVPRKGIDTMIKSIARIKNKNVILLLIGEGPEKKRYIKIASKLGIKDRVIFKGWRKDIPQILKGSDILFLPSRGEGLPGIVMEAMASGLPIVASNIPCTNDLVADAKNGFLCKIDHIACFADRIKKLSENKRLREKLGKEGRKRIKEFDWNKIVKKYLKLYQ